jgi:hypothetical protein
MMMAAGSSETSSICLITCNKVITSAFPSVVIKICSFSDQNISFGSTGIYDCLTCGGPASGISCAHDGSGVWREVFHCCLLHAEREDALSDTSRRRIYISRTITHVLKRLSWKCWRRCAASFVHITHWNVPYCILCIVCGRTWTLTSPITVAARSKTWTVFAHSNTGVVVSNPNRGMDYCMILFCL